MQEPDLPEFLYHIGEDEDPLPCFAMTNLYEAILTHDPSRNCVRITPDMLHSLKRQEALQMYPMESTSCIPWTQVRLI